MSTTHDFASKRDSVRYINIVAETTKFQDCAASDLAVDRFKGANGNC